jgi:linoleoyl-CoA desaturase
MPLLQTGCILYPPTKYYMKKKELEFRNPQENKFFIELRQKVNLYFKEKRLSTKANRAMIIKSILLIAVTFISYLLIISGLCNIWQMWLLSLILGLGVSGVSFCVLHDALHGAYSESSRINRLLGIGMDFLGSSSYLWHIKHNLAHHTYTNIQDFDEDIAVKIIRFSPHSPYLSIHRFQHLYSFWLYSLVYLNVVFIHNFYHILKRDFGPYQNIKHPPIEFIKLLFWKLIFVFFTIILPLIMLKISVLQFFIGFLTFTLTVGFCFGLIFNLAHVVEETEYPMPNENDEIENAWAVHQLMTTNNFAIQNQFLTWFLGGLNHQIEHHLFPNICSIHYPALSKIVQETAHKYQLPYHCHSTFSAALGSHYRFLKKLSYENKPVKNIVESVA